MEYEGAGKAFIGRQATEPIQCRQYWTVGGVTQLMAANVFLTVDVECSIGGAFADPRLSPVGSEKRVFARFRGREYGIRFMMQVAERYRLPLIFFVETFQQHYFGPQQTRRIVEALSSDGHDIQLHLHPNYLNFLEQRPWAQKFSDLCGDYPLEKQVDMIAQAKEMLMAAGAPTPVAFRAGCFGADPNTLKALHANGFLIDTSYCQAYIGRPCLLPDCQINDATRCEGVYEFPITHFRERSGVRSPRPMPLDINGVGFEEIRHVLRAAKKGNGPRNVTILLHSFSFIKPYDVQYRRVRPRWNVIRRFKRLCRYLAENPSSFRVRTFGEISREELDQAAETARQQWPQVPPALAWVRLAEQAMDRWL